MTYGSLFSGAGGFDLGFEAAGMECRWLSEIDPKCQDLSVAGQRKGMAGGRSGLFHEMVRICKRVRPRFIVWENVDGAFSSNDGRDFAAVLRAFTGVQVEVPSDGWGRAGFIKTPFPAWRWNCAWRVFDAQYFGVPQRRRRVFLVGSLGDGSCAEVLFEPESLRGDSPPSRKTGQRVAGTVASRPTGGGGLGTDFDLDGGLVPEIAFALTTRNERNEPTTETLLPIAHSLRGEGFDASEDGTGRGTPIVAVPVPHTDVMPALRAGAAQDGPGHGARSGDSKDEQIVPIAFNHQAGGSACPISPSEDRANCLQVGQQQAVSIHMGVRRLVPVECEKLMGWPPHHTAGYADSTRYKMCGNGVVAPCASWIARRIKRFLK